MPEMHWSWWEMLAVIAACWLVGSFAVAIALGRIIRRSDQAAESAQPMRESLSPSEWMALAAVDDDSDGDSGHSASSTRLKPVLAEHMETKAAQHRRSAS